MTEQRDFLSRLADRGEEVLAKVADAPGAHKAMELMGSLKDRVDELSKRVTGLEGLERRLDELEARVVELEGGEAPDEPAEASDEPAV
jgi:hypothetical protein